MSRGEKEFGPGLDGDKGGGFRQAAGRMFGDGQNPLRWSLPLYRLAGIQVRVHVLYVLCVIGYLLSTLDHDAIGFWLMALAMAGLFVLVLLHEYGHCLACRRVGGEADEIIMWPLGGLASCRPPHEWRANLVTTLGGPLVNVLLWPILGVTLWQLAGWSSIVFNPFDPKTALGGLHLQSGGRTPYWLIGLWWLYYLNAVLLFFNVVPMFPMDGGRALQALLWRRHGEQAAARTVTTVGFGAAAVLFVFGAVFRDGQVMMAIAAFGAVACWFERRRLELLSTPDGGMVGLDLTGSLAPDAAQPPRSKPKAPSRGELKRKQREEEEQAEVDRILAKIAGTGMSSLTKAERRALERATERRRGR
jgi:stage IV sporulation protein FB